MYEVIRWIEDGQWKSTGGCIHPQGQPSLSTAPPSSIARQPYIHVQSTPLAETIINHGLGERRSPALFDLLWTEIGGVVEQPTEFQAIVRFEAPATFILRLY